MKKETQNKFIIGGLIFALVTFVIIKNKKPTKDAKNIKPLGKLTDQDKKAFINKILPSAKVIGNSIGVPPLFILAQLALESNFGRSTLTSKYNNFGGIKAVGNQPSVNLLTTECKNGVCSKVYQKFAIYPTVTDGLKAQSKIYQNRYFKQHLNKTSNPLTYAKLIQSGPIKYATALNYPDTINKFLIEIDRLNKV